MRPPIPARGRGLRGPMRAGLGAYFPPMAPVPQFNLPPVGNTPVDPGQGPTFPPSPYDAFSSLLNIPQATKDAETYFRSSPSAPSGSGGDSSVLPWLAPPPGSQPFVPVGAITTPNPTGVDTTVLQFTVPFGWDGVITQIANTYTGPGLTIGQTSLSWRIERNFQPVRNFDSIQVSYGTFGAGGSVVPYILPAGIQISSDDIISFVVNHAVGSTFPVQGTSIVVFLGGWFYPKQLGTMQ